MKKTIRNLVIFILLIVLTFTIILKDQDISEIFNIVANAKKEFLIIAIIAMCIYVLCESINVRRTLKALGEKTSILKNIKYTLIGFFFSAITPAASGGQPMEIYYMHKDNISVAHSTLALLMQLCSVQIVTITFAIISVILNFQIVSNGLIYLFILGIGLNLTALLLFVIAIFSKRLSIGLIKFTVKVLKFFKVQNIENKQLKLENELEKYQESAIYIKNNKLVMIKTLLTTAIQIIVYFSVPYWVYCAFGFGEYNIFQIIMLQSILYATVSGIPSPGAVGVSEGGFIEIFKNVFPTTMMSSAMLLNRGISFYLLVIVSGIIVTINTFKSKKNEKSQTILENKEGM